MLNHSEMIRRRRQMHRRIRDVVAERRLRSAAAGRSPQVAVEQRPDQPDEAID